MRYSKITAPQIRRNTKSKCFGRETARRRRRRTLLIIDPTLVIGKVPSFLTKREFSHFKNFVECVIGFWSGQKNGHWSG